MPIVFDIDITDTIVPVFDRTNNPSAYHALTNLLLDRPDEIEAVKCRQKIIQAIIAQPSLVEHHRYAAGDCTEVYSFVNNSRALAEAEHGMRFLSLPAARRPANSRMLQAASLFSKWQRSYFDALNLSDFPAEYTRELVFMRDFLAEITKRLACTRQAADNKQPLRRDLKKTLRFLHESVTSGRTARFWESLFLFEAYLSIAATFKKRRMTFPALGSNKLSFKNIYHPSVQDAVPNDITFESNILVLTGSNMSGKSTLLRSLAVNIFVAQAGLPVFAEQADVPFFKTMIVKLHHNDDPGSGFSHFMKDIESLKTLLVHAQAAENCFAVFDELFTGTSADDARSLFKETIAGLQQFTNVFCCISTHLHQGREPLFGEKVPVAVAHLDTNLQNGIPVFTYKLRGGWSTTNVGKQLFIQSGLQDLLMQTPGTKPYPS